MSFSFLPFVALTSDVQGQLNKIPSFDFDHNVNSLHPTFHLKYIPGANTVNFFGSSIKAIDIIGIIFLTIGFVIISWAAFQDNGRWKRAGYVITISSWCVLVFAHFMIAGGFAYKTFFEHWQAAFMIVASQILIYAIPIILYYIGSSNLEFYELTSDANFLESSQKQFRYIFGIEALAVIIYFLFGIVL